MRPPSTTPGWNASSRKHASHLNWSTPACVRSTALILGAITSSFLGAIVYALFFDAWSREQEVNLALAAQHRVQVDASGEVLWRFTLFPIVQKLQREAKDLLPIRWAPMNDLETWCDEAERAHRSFLGYRTHRDILGDSLSHDTIQLMEGLTSFFDPGEPFHDEGFVGCFDSTLPSMRRRLQRARELSDPHGRFGDVEALWNVVLQELANDPRYEGLRIQPDLVPIGKDPESLLWEFAHAPSGALPTRDDRGHVRIDRDTSRARSRTRPRRDATCHLACLEMRLQVFPTQESFVGGGRARRAASASYQPFRAHAESFAWRSPRRCRGETFAEPGAATGLPLTHRDRSPPAGCGSSPLRLPSPERSFDLLAKSNGRRGQVVKWYRSSLALSFGKKVPGATFTV